MKGKIRNLFKSKKENVISYLCMHTLQNLLPTRSWAKKKNKPKVNQWNWVRMTPKFRLTSRLISETSQSRVGTELPCLSMKIELNQNWIQQNLRGETCFHFVMALKVQMSVCICYLQRHSRAGWGKHKHILWWVRTDCLFLPNWVYASTAPLQMSATWFPSVFFFSRNFSCFYILPSIRFFSAPPCVIQFKLVLIVCRLSQHKHSRDVISSASSRFPERTFSVHLTLCPFGQKIKIWAIINTEFSVV